MNSLFNGIYAGRQVLVTGHTGFKGSWLCLWLTALGARVTGLALAPDTEPSHWNLLGLNEVRDLRVDLRNHAELHRTLEQIQPEIVFHLAAQPLVRRSYLDPLATFQTNVLGLVNLFEALRNCASTRAIINATTDKVYLEKPVSTGYREDHPLGGHDPYSTSKACAELISDCYRKSYFSGIASGAPRLATARAGNVIGGGDWAEDRLVPDMVRAAISGKPLHIRHPNAVRPWQHVLEPLSGYLRLGQTLLAGEPMEGAWNLGPTLDATLSVKALVSRMHSEWPNLQINTSPGAQPHEAETLQLDCSKAATELNWHPVWQVAETLYHTARWYRALYEQKVVLSETDLHDYVAAARVTGQAWAT